MAKITLRLRANPKTGKKDILIEYESEADQTGWEHEREHKRIVESLIEKGVLEEAELGQIVRVKPGQAETQAETEALAEGETLANPQG